jgi:hypothetical protein
MTAGAIGFFGTGLAMMGLFNWLPQSAPWPIGFMESVAVTPNGDQIVTHSVGRIQIYDPEWHFKRGWFLESRGGPYKIIKIDNETIEVVANHSRSHWKFDIDGNLISRAKLDDYSRFSAIDEWQFTPATWWLLPIASPWLGFGSLAIGACSLRVANRVATLVRRRNRGSRGHF